MDDINGFCYPWDLAESISEYSRSEEFKQKQDDINRPYKKHAEQERRDMAVCWRKGND